MGPLAVAGIQAGAQLASDGVNALVQGATNRKNRRFAREMYGIQRQHALEDWNRQNEYNDPKNQMARLKAAGLNPNLVYGNGATTTADAVRSASMDTPHATAPRFDLGSAASRGLGAYYDTQIKQGNVDLLKKQNDIATQEILLKAAQVDATIAGTHNTAVNTAMGKYNYENALRLSDISFETAKAALDKTVKETAISLDRNERERAMHAPNMEKAAIDILRGRIGAINDGVQRQKMYAEIENLRKSGELMDEDIKLRKQGIYPGDPLWLRLLINKLDPILNGNGLENNFNGSLWKNKPDSRFTPKAASDHVRNYMDSVRRSRK